ncbi:MFS transporter [Acidisphaera sp. L21]|uniref:MFS transporter n=1 Tax=Acidisphaera sp. L21 TaxID=1641851 RepID=UPI00131EC092|nr:MFS transporter [Acidisphaera sp. L21]
MSALPRFLAFYATLFAAFGVASPFFPSLLQQDGIGPTQLGVVLGAGTAIRLLAGPVCGRLADRTGNVAITLAGFTAASAVVAFGYAPARGFLLLLAISIVHAIALAPLTPLADALTLGAAETGRGFRYGWVRGTGSAAFVVGALASGQVVGWAGLGAIIWLNGGLLVVAACVAWLLPNRVAGAHRDSVAVAARASAWSLARIPTFVQLMGFAAMMALR